MDQQNRSTSREIVELLRHKISTRYVRASDTDVARALGVGRASVSRWMNGAGPMSIAMLKKANEILDLPSDQITEFSIRLLADLDEGESTDSHRFYLSAISWIEAQRKLSKIVPVILAAFIGLTTSPTSNAYARPADAIHADGLYIMRSRRNRPRSRVRGLWNPLSTLKFFGDGPLWCMA